METGVPSSPITVILVNTKKFEKVGIIQS
jgi:hypothetical protein